MKPELEKKVKQAIKLIQMAGKDGTVVEVAYSGGKDSDVILELTRMSGIKYRAIYKNTTIDPPYTIKHCKEQGVEILKPKKTFYELLQYGGFPNRFMRFCCKNLKEYKVLDRSIIGVRKAESVRRKARYNEPTECRFYGSKKEHVEAFYPILEWTDEDVVEFVKERGIKLHPLYYRNDGTIDASRRLGCLCCPLQSQKKRLEAFKQYPNMVKLYIRGGQIYRDTHPDCKSVKIYNSVYEHFCREVFFKKQSEFLESRDGLFEIPDYKKQIEDYFNIKL